MKNIITSAVVALVVALIVVGLVGGKSTNLRSFAGITNFDTLGLTGFKVGSGCNDSNATCTGTTFTHLIGTTGSLLGADVAQAATTTAPYDIAVSNLLTTDRVIAQFASTTYSTSGFGAAVQGASGWVITSAHASSTAGFVTVMVANLTGRSQAISASAGIASSTNVFAF